MESVEKLGMDEEAFYFQQDNDPKHTSKLAQNWLASIDLNVLPWPSNSPDMNLIENIWDILDRCVHSHDIKPRNEDELWKALQEEWRGIDQVVIDHLYNSMKNRIDSVIANKGWNTRY